MNILAINPWIVDCAAYDFWLKPYGFLAILTYLNDQGINVDYIDCLQRKINMGYYGRGQYHCEIIDKPSTLSYVPRYFKRYGITPQEFKSKIKDKDPHYILITSSMTYWYPAILDAIKILKECFSEVPIILGGTYATLCYDHAKKNIPADAIIKNNDLPELFKLLNVSFDEEAFYSTLPLYENFYDELDYVVFRTSWGCPFSCSFCAIKELSTGFYRIPVDKVIKFIDRYAKKGLKDFVLYDDAFLYEDAYAKRLLKEVKKLNLNLRFHTPNALHLKFLDEEIAHLLKKSGFINPHFGLETLNPGLQKSWGDKVNRTDLIKGIEALKRGGFREGEFSVYLLLGYPGQKLSDLRDDAHLLHSLGAKVSLAEFSPVPKTKLFSMCKSRSFDPLLHNNSIFSSFEDGKIEEFWSIKNYVRSLNKKFHFSEDRSSLRNKRVVLDVKS